MVVNPLETGPVYEVNEDSHEFSLPEQTPG
jgi:hypothetical protein